MATKDRTSLKNDFANGKYATGEKFADLIDSMKVVQLPVVDPQALGTSLSFIDSISQDADGKITATKKTLDLANAHELNPFKGWYKTGDTLPTDGFDGAYLYFKDTSELTGQTTIYRWNGTTYADTGTVVDTSNVQTFETGQAVNGVAIDGTGLVNPAPNALAKAVDVAEVKDSLMVEGNITLSQLLNYSIDNDTADISANYYRITFYYPVTQGDVVHATVELSETKNVRYGFSAVEPAAGVHVDNVQLKNGTSVDIRVRATQDGYFVMSHSTYMLTYTNTCTIARLELPELVKEDLRKTGFYFSDDEDITSVVSGLPLRDMFIGASGKWASGSERKHVLLDATGVGSIIVTPNSEQNASIAFLASYDTPVTGVYPDYVEGTTVVFVEEEEEFMVPYGTKWICFRASDTGANYMPDGVVITGRANVSPADGDDDDARVIYPPLRYGTLRRSNGKYDDNPTYANRKMVVTPRYIKTNGGFSVTSSISCKLYVLCYGGDYIYIGYVSAAGNERFDVVAGTPLDISVLPGTEYVKMVFSTVDYDPMAIPVVSLNGHFGEDWDTFNERPSDSGYHKVQVVVNATDPNCCDNETSNVQDAPNYLVDYGVICLPETYRNVGAATRLIIYCHGSAVNYTDSDAPRFNSTDLEPDYWLAEGYAVMDVEGNPFNNTDVHGNIPQSIDCYISAYKWAIEHYNLRRDGIFLGGRSLGSRTALGLARLGLDFVPVIACCPNAATGTPTASWNYAPAARRAFWANHMGFENQPTWTADSPMTTAEWNCLKDNWDKLVRCAPMWDILMDLPSKDVLMADNLNISKNAMTSATEEGVYGVLHAKVRCPVKLFGCNQDTTAPVDRGTKLINRMFLNSGHWCEMRLFDTTLSSGQHHYDTQDPSLRATVTTRFGVEMSNVPIVYIEMLQFWRRFEQEN